MCSAKRCGVFLAQFGDAAWFWRPPLMFCFLIAVMPLLRARSDRVAHHFSPVLPACWRGYHHHHHHHHRCTPGLSSLFVGSDGSSAFGLYGIVILVCVWTVHNERSGAGLHAAVCWTLGPSVCCEPAISALLLWNDFITGNFLFQSQSSHCLSYDF